MLSPGLSVTSTTRQQFLNAVTGTSVSWSVMRNHYYVQPKDRAKDFMCIFLIHSPTAE